MSDHYILVGHEPKEEPDLQAWFKWYGEKQQERRVALDQIGEVEIATIFLGMDHSLEEGLLHLFETRIFNGPLDGAMNRYATWDEAVAGHKAMVERARKAEDHE